MMTMSRSGYRVQVSRMISLPSAVTGDRLVNSLVTSVPVSDAHGCSSSCVTADAVIISAHFLVSGTNSSLPPPHHRC